ncbi:hypothetical protein SH584_06535 [Sphingomonas sp. LY29]|uniref:hypothetical protein n=1 Tax=Sphingomonas sp. LY29 TaxID=3095341 RepID=UPI002D767861|nr:hypothetical protein [Sphingomonas sp. LY29]WRP24727.1 hypothetical protein SH584_06535 [Sphingomonas sp. LY29]
MNRGMMLLGALALASCAQQPEDSSGDVTTSESMSPDVSPSAAPTVAWTYDYSYRLDDVAIAGAQEASAAKCEALGPARCRIVGLTYTVDGDRNIEGDLSVKLAPEIAREFGKQASEIVTKAGGDLARMEFSGDDTEAQSRSATTAQSDARARIAAIRQDLRDPRLGDRERTALQSSLQQLNDSLSSAQTTADNVSARLASTPMTLHYVGRGRLTGFVANPLVEAGRSFVASMVTMVSAVLQFLAILLPWVLLLGLSFAIARSRPALTLWRWLTHWPSVRSLQPVAQDDDVAPPRA